MKVCIPCDGPVEHTSQARNCGAATCVDPVEAIIGRGVEAVVVTSLSPSSLMRFHNAGVKVLVTDNPSVMVTLDMLARGGLQELTMEMFAALGKKDW